MNEDLIPLLDKAYFFLKFRPRSEKEVRDYLYKKISNKLWSREDAEKIIENLKGRGLIDDAKFVDWFIRQRLALKPKGERVLRRELRQKGIEDELVDRYFSKNSLNEEGLARQILEKRWPRLIGLSKRKRFEKAARFLMSRGFSFDLTKKTIEDREKLE